MENEIVYPVKTGEVYSRDDQGLWLNSSYVNADGSVYTTQVLVEPAQPAE